jgi:serine/threonine protein kinase
MTYAGVSLFRRSSLTSDSVNQVFFFHVSIDSNGNCRDSLLATLRSIHRADILHGDIRLPNTCATPSGEAFIVDFGRSRKEKAQEIRELSHIFGMDSPTKPAAKAVEKPVLRRSARIQELQRKAKVEPKNLQVKHGKSTSRK